jgi:uncharacterized protein YecT (DUF1311 family)
MCCSGLRRHGRVWSVSMTLVALWTGALAVEMPDELKPDELADRLNQECGEQWGFPGPHARCLLEKEEAFGKELEQVYKKALTLAGKNDTLLRENQRSWLKYQESGCKLDEVLLRKEGPNFGRRAAAGCLLRTTLERLQELREIVTTLETYGPIE